MEFWFLTAPFFDPSKNGRVKNQNSRAIETELVYFTYRTTAQYNKYFL